MPEIILARMSDSLPEELYYISNEDGLCIITSKADEMTIGDLVLADDACDGTVLALDDDTETGEYVGVDGANLIEIQESAVVDVTNHETNLVGMRHEHDLGAVFTFAMGDAVAVGIGCDFVDIRTDCVGKESCDALLAA